VRREGGAPGSAKVFVQITELTMAVKDELWAIAYSGLAQGEPHSAAVLLMLCMHMIIWLQVLLLPARVQVRVCSSDHVLTGKSIMCRWARISRQEGGHGYCWRAGRSRHPPQSWQAWRRCCRWAVEPCVLPSARAMCCIVPLSWQAWHDAMHT
jgi:hypothetical protein